MGVEMGDVPAIYPVDGPLEPDAGPPPPDAGPPSFDDYTETAWDVPSVGRALVVHGLILAALLVGFSLRRKAH